MVKTQDSIKVVTEAFVKVRDGGPYWRVAIYEFRGDPLRANFSEDCNIGSKVKEWVASEAKRIAKERGIVYCPGVSLGDKVDKVFSYLLS